MISRAVRKHLTWIVWALRIVIGATFVFSGFAKVVDPWGFVIKMHEYLTAWGIDSWAPRQLLFIAAAGLAMFEFTAGLMLMLGCLRRITVLSLTAMIAVMLPLTLYIWIASPVSDCGCFGDAFVIPNWASFAKNVVLMALLVILIPLNGMVPGAVTKLYQWMPLAASIIYCLVASMIGYMIQPIYDFRPYKTGMTLLPEGDDMQVEFVYELNGERRVFGADDLPDSSWTFVERAATKGSNDPRQLEIYDGDECVTDFVIEQEGPQVLLVVSNPDFHGRARASLANRINDYITERGGSMIGLLPLRGKSLEEWTKLTNPHFDVYTVDFILLEELVRGDAAIVYLNDGVIQWKRDIYSMPSDFTDANAHLDPDSPTLIDEVNALDEISPLDDGRAVRYLTLSLLLVILLSSLLGHRKPKR